MNQFKVGDVVRHMGYDDHNRGDIGVVASEGRGMFRIKVFSDPSNLWSWSKRTAYWEKVDEQV